MLTTYIVEGGIGKCIAFSALIPKLAEKAEEPIQVYTPYVDIFSGNPDVKWVLDQNSIPMNDSRVQESEIIYCEPYKSNFVKGRKHLIESYADLLGVSYEGESPKIYSDHLKGQADQLLSENNIGRFMVVQFSGGQTPVGWSPENQYASIDPGRNYHPFLAQTVVDEIKKGDPELAILNYTLPNEPSYSGTVRINAPYAVWHEILKKSEGFIGIDSSLQHLSASAKKPGVVIWGTTRWSQLGYGHNYNINYHSAVEWDEAVFSPQDPRNTMVPPKQVVEAYETLRGQ